MPMKPTQRESGFVAERRAAQQSKSREWMYSFSEEANEAERAYRANCAAEGVTPNNQVGRDFKHRKEIEVLRDRIAALESTNAELLAACKAALPYLQESWKRDGLGGQFEMMDFLRAAIANAERTAHAK